MDAGRGGGEHRRAQRDRLITCRHLDVHVHDVRDGLHHEAALLGHAADGDGAVDANPLRAKALDDGARAEGGGFDEAAIDAGRIRAQADAGDRAGEPLVGVRRPAPVHPVERQRSGLLRAQRCRALLQRRDDLLADALGQVALHVVGYPV